MCRSGCTSPLGDADQIWFGGGVGGPVWYKSTNSRAALGWNRISSGDEINVVATGRIAGATTPQARTRHEPSAACPHILSLIAATTLGVLAPAPKGQSEVGETLPVVGSSALGSRNAASIRLATMRLRPSCPSRAAIENPFLASVKTCWRALRSSVKLV